MSADLALINFECSNCGVSFPISPESREDRQRVVLHNDGACSGEADPR